MMVVVTNVLLALALVGYPTKMYEDTDQCFQFWPLVASYLYYACYRGMLHVMFLLDKGPFYGKGDCVNVDALLVSSERFTFHVFRTSFKTLPSDVKCVQEPEVSGVKGVQKPDVQEPDVPEPAWTPDERSDASRPQGRDRQSLEI